MNRAKALILQGYRPFGHTGTNTVVTFMDPEGNRVAIRPESLPSLMRAYSEHKISETQKLSKWYHCAPVIVYDEKQKKFINSWEYGFELLGEFSPLIEVQLISLVWKFLKSLGLENLILEINSVGKTDSRKDYEETFGLFNEIDSKIDQLND